MKCERLYPLVGFPVPRGTPMLGPLVRWEHSQDWPIVQAKDVINCGNVGTAKASVGFTVDPFATDILRS